MCSGIIASLPFESQTPRAVNEVYWSLLNYYIGVRLYKKNWKKVTAHVGTRISAQVRSHA